MLAFRKENTVPQKQIPRNISNIDIRIFGKSLQFLAPGVYVDDVAYIICQLFKFSILQQHDKNSQRLC